MFIHVPIVLAATSSMPYRYHVSPCAANSFRVRVELMSPPPAVAATQKALARALKEEGLSELPGAFVCAAGAGTEQLTSSSPRATSGNLLAQLTSDGNLRFSRVDLGTQYFTATASLEENLASSPPLAGYLKAKFTTTPGDCTERLYGLGQGEWTKKGGGCPEGPQEVVPQARNGQRIQLLQTKFHVTIPTAFSSAGYGLLFHMPGYGNVSLGAHGIGGTTWEAAAALWIDFWVSGLPAGAGVSMEPLHEQYADATGHAPPLREDAMIFWQSRNRYKSTDIALGIADKYAALKLPVGVLVIDYKNMVHDGDFVPDKTCYPSVSSLSAGIRSKLNATTVFSFWPEVLNDARAFAVLNSSGCLINGQLGGHAISADRVFCRDLIWQKFLLPHYYDQGVTAYWLDETDGEGTLHGYDPNSGGYHTQWGPRAFASNLWVNDYVRTFTEPIRAIGDHAPLVLVRGIWAGGQKHGAVLWSSDIQSNFETLAAMVPQGVHASMSGIPYAARHMLPAKIFALAPDALSHTRPLDEPCCPCAAK